MIEVNVPALVAVAIIGGAFLAIFGRLYLGAVRSQRSGELATEGVRILRWAVIGQLALYLLLALTAFLGIPSST